MSNPREKRDGNRFAIDFEVDVVTEYPAGLEHRERTVLMAISQEDAMVVSYDTGRYFPGQSLELAIHLPGTKNVKACMRAKATVVRIDPLRKPSIEKKNPEECMTVAFDAPLRFERIGVNAMNGFGNLE